MGCPEGAKLRAPRTSTNSVSLSSVVAPAPAQSQPTPAEALKVADEFVTLAGPAVLRCRPGSAGPIEAWLGQNQLEWFTSDGVRVLADELWPPASQQAGPGKGE